MALSTGMKLFLAGSAVFAGAVAYKNYEKKRKAKTAVAGLTTSETCLTGIYVPGVGMDAYIANDLLPQVLATNQNLITNIAAPLQKDLWNYLLYIVTTAMSADEQIKAGLKFVAKTCDWNNIVVTETSPQPFRDVWSGINSLVMLAEQNLASKGAL
jgi:hypothetical protein